MKVPSISPQPHSPQKITPNTAAKAGRSPEGSAGEKATESSAEAARESAGEAFGRRIDVRA